MQWFAQLSMPVRIATIACLSLLVAGPLVNWAIASLSYFGNRISPWQRSCESALPPLRWFHYVPMFGWLFRTDKPADWGRWYRVRPLLMELLVPAAIVGLYIWETSGGLTPHPDQPIFRMPLTIVDLHWQCLGHITLFLFLMVATFIDFDEMMIPDSVTVPGTLLGLFGSIMIPQWHLWTDSIDLDQRWPDQLHLASPNDWPAWTTTMQGCLIAVFVFVGWCFALADRRVILRRGLKKAVVYFGAGLVRDGRWRFLVALAVIGSAIIVAAFGLASETVWRSLFNSLCGLAIGGCFVWIVRIVASLALGMEALGFGDVTLMAMVGTFVGWQPVAIAFFLAPLFALLVVVGIALVTGNTAAPFGPYLCIATAYCVVFWDSMWNQWLQPIFGLGSTLAMILLAMFMLMGVVLTIWRLIKTKVMQRAV